MLKTHSQCRFCRSEKLSLLLDLGNQPLSGVFPRPESPDPGSSPLELMRCDACGLVQLRHSADVESMYGATYGYSSSISSTMVRHLQGKVSNLRQAVELKRGDVVLDIGCNDGTLLNAYGPDPGLTRLGIDPSSRKFIDRFEPGIEVIIDFFSAGRVQEVIAPRKCKIITSIAMFYDIDDPADFMRQIRALLAEDGIWALEVSYLPLLLTQLTYDQICHEHVTYLSLGDLCNMMKRSGLKPLDASFNDINGGSVYVYASRDDSPHQANAGVIQKILDDEAFLGDPAVFDRFKSRVLAHRDEVRHFLELAREGGKRVYGYGASTKGNVVLNYCGVGPRQLVAIGDTTPQKRGLVTPGTRIPIISHQDLERAQCDYLYVLIWHYRNDIIRDWIPFLRAGGKLVFNLPRLHVVDLNNYERYLGRTFRDLAYQP